MKTSVITEVVERDLCIGCGLCAVMCPNSHFEIKFNKYGEYNPVASDLCTSGCNLCLNVCPFANTDENEDSIGKNLYGEIPGIMHLPETGYYLDTYVGYSEKHRQKSASGGIATWLLESLIIEGVVDHVICVAPTGNADKLFDFFVFSSIEDIRKGSGSAYYPVEMSRIIRYVIDHPGRYAITGLPCFIKAIRLAQKRNNKLMERIVVTVGLVCGQLKSRFFTEYIAALVGVKSDVKEVQYRGKSPDQPASNFYFSFRTIEDKEQKIFWRDGISEAWINRWFTPNACNYCDDVFAECADVVCMDAWLPEYSEDWRGMNFVLVRSPIIQSIFDKGKDIIFNPISIKQMITSQDGVIAVKRDHLAYRLYLGKDSIPVKRVTPARVKGFFLRDEIEVKEKMRVMSKERWRRGEGDAKALRNVLGIDIKRLSIERKISIIITFLNRTFTNIF